MAAIFYILSLLLSSCCDCSFCILCLSCASPLLIRCTRCPCSLCSRYSAPNSFLLLTTLGFLRSSLYMILLPTLFFFQWLLSSYKVLCTGLILLTDDGLGVAWDWYNQVVSHSIYLQASALLQVGLGSMDTTTSIRYALAPWACTKKWTTKSPHCLS